jgi:hypothetical protein
MARHAALGRQHASCARPGEVKLRSRRLLSRITISTNHLWTLHEKREALLNDRYAHGIERERTKIKTSDSVNL